MNGFFKFDEIAKRLSKLFQGTKKLKRIIKSVMIGWTVFIVVATIWELIPKGEKLPEADAKELIDAVSAEKENAQESVTEDVQNSGLREKNIQTADV